MARFFQRLDIQGFKSFLNKTSIEFLDGITIVVGPNGCGKSNVLDAIRWVLGETSAKSLRGERMGDVIFRGSAHHRPAGFAAVTLTCDNRSGVLRLEQGEVSVGRRLFANGESQYMTNRQTCRMRDVQELFMDTGLGADGYSIIEQGRISEMVMAKPEQRREIFEEAAGIARYKARREETMRRLVRVEEDLVRLYDHVTEVEKTAATLYRQARRAQRWRELTRRLRRAQKRAILLRHQIHATQKAEAEARHAATKDAFNEAAAKLASAEAAMADTARRLEALQRERQALVDQRHDRTTRIEREKHRAEMVEQKRAANAERVAMIDRELASGDARDQIMESTFASLEADVAREEQELAAQEERLQGLTRMLEEMRRSGDQRAQAQAHLRQEVALLQASRSAAENERRVASALIEKLTAELESHGTTVAQLAEGAKAAEAEAEAARTRAAELRQQVAAIAEEHRTIQQRLGERDRAKDELRQRVEHLTGETQQVASRFQALQELEEQYEGYFRGVKEVMQAGQKGRLKGIVGVVSALIKGPAELDLALEVALGGDIQDIVVETVEDAKAAIRFLKQIDAGRATFLPLDFLHVEIGSPPHGVIGRRGVIGLARELVTYDRKLDVAVRHLFGNTVIVDHLDIAVELEREGRRTRYVSVQGDIVNPRGVLSGGSHRMRGLLSRSREIAELKDRRAALVAELGRVKAEHQAARDEVGALHARSGEVQARLHELQMAEARAEKDLHAAEDRRRERRNSLAAAEARAHQQRTDLLRHSDTVQRAAEASAQLEATLRDAEERLARESAGATEAQKAMLEQAEKVSAARAEASARRERCGAMRLKLRELVAERDRARTEREKRALEREQVLRQSAELVHDREDAEGQIARLTLERDAISQKIDQAEQDLQAVSREVAAARAGLSGLIRERNEWDNRMREAEIALAEARVQLEAVEREASDEFAMTVEDIAEELGKEEAAAATVVVPLDGASEAEDAEPSDAQGSGEDDRITDVSGLRRLVNELRTKIQRLGPVNEAAIEEYAKAKERLDFLVAQRDDLNTAKEQLRKTIEEIDATTSRLFGEAYATIRGHFSDIYRRLFNGGTADLVLVQSESQPEPGIEIMATPPGKNLAGSLSLMSGGEKALTALALMLALFRFRPSPICILDEVDAPLDDTNVQRMCDLLKDFSQNTQFLIVTHNKITMSLADTIYGVTMQEPGVSKVVSVRFQDAERAGLLDEPVPSR
jgi:chromosome segregation protein